MSGKWDDKNIPHSGWICTDIADLGHYPAMTCQMCEREDIRYAHYMEHPKYRGQLIVGCVCAGKMENGDLEGAKKREAFMKSRTEKKKRWLSRKWKISKNGNQYIKTDDFVVVMKHHKDGNWSALVKNESGSYEKWCKTRYHDENKMKLAAFDCLTSVLKERKFKIKENPVTEPEKPQLQPEILKPSVPSIPSATVTPAPPKPVVKPAPPVPPAPPAAQTELFEDAKVHDFTAEQKYIFNFVKNGQEHGIIDAVAGAGKTTTIIECSKYAGVQSEILFCAFNKSIQLEIAAKFNKQGMNQVTVKTIHALGYQILIDNNNTGKNLVLQDNKYRTILSNDRDLNDKIQKYEEKLLHINDYSPDETDNNKKFAIKDFLYKFRERLLDMNQKIRATLTPEDKASFKSMAEHFNFFNETVINTKTFNKELDIYFECSKLLLDAGNALAKESMIIDFTDMLYLPYIWNLSASRQFSFLFIDECQDLSKAQLSVVLKYGKKDGRILAVGDPYQSIYGFAGADIESFSRIKKTINAKQLPLTTCFRCPPNVVAMAKEIRSDISASKKVNGKIEELTLKQVVSTARPNDLVISRYREPILYLVFEFINNNIKVQIHKDEVGEIIDELKQLFKQEERSAKISGIPGGFEELKYTVYQRWLFIIKKESRKIHHSSERELYIQTRTEYLDNKLEFMHKKYLQWKTNCFTINEMLIKIKDFISAPDNCVKLSTIHRAKGLEANKVFILNFNELPHYTPGQKPWEKTQEENLKYVAITRALNELYLVKSQKRDEAKKDASLFDELAFKM